jgi:hypothetical protein
LARKKQSDDELAYAELVREAEPLLPIARALKESIDEKLVGGGTSSTLDVDAAWNAAVQRVAEAMIAEQLRSLDPERILRLYADAVDDETLKARLGAWAEAKAEELERAQQRRQLQVEVARTGAIELARLEADLHISIGLFEPRHISQAHKESSIPASRTVSVRLLDPRRGTAEVIADTALVPAHADLFVTQTRGRIGSRIVEDGEGRLEPRLQIHAPLGFDFGGGPQCTTEVIGYADIGRGLLLLDGGGQTR